MTRDEPFKLHLTSIEGENYLKVDTLMEWLVFLAKDSPHAARAFLSLRDALKEMK